MLTYFHMTWPNHAKIIKATTPRVALMKGTHLNRSLEFWLYDVWTNEKSVCNFYIKFDRKKQKMVYLIFRFKIYLINAASWNELKLLDGLRSFY